MATIRGLNALLMNLGDELGDAEVKRMRQMLSGNQISKRDIETLKTPAELFQKLEECGFISDKNLDFLKELLTKIDRAPLIAKYIEGYEKSVKKEAISKTEIGSLQVLFDDLCRQLGSEDERTIRYLLTNQQISKRDMMKVDDPADIFNKLVESGFISLHNLEFLKNLFKTMHRPPLVNIVEEFERKSR